MSCGLGKSGAGPERVGADLAHFLFYREGVGNGQRAFVTAEFLDHGQPLLLLYSRNRWETYRWRLALIFQVQITVTDEGNGVKR